MDLHPSLRSPSLGQEIEYFNEYYELGLDWYRSKMPFVYLNQTVFEKSTAYFFKEKCPKRVFDYNPKTKLIVIVRDPILRGIMNQ
jgi:hypothetical protein